MNNHYQFARDLVKSRIAETVFAQMLRESEAYIVLEFRHDKVMPELVQHGVDQNEVVDALRAAPDFAVLDRENKSVHLIEVKYRADLNPSEILQCAQRMHAAWNPSYLFVATLDGFYFDEVSAIVGNNGQIPPFYDNKIPQEVADKYLQILRDFES